MRIVQSVARSETDRRCAIACKDGAPFNAMCEQACTQICNPVVHKTSAEDDKKITNANARLSAYAYRPPCLELGLHAGAPLLEYASTPSPLRDVGPQKLSSYGYEPAAVVSRTYGCFHTEQPEV
jgi:hypothetical protein